MNRCYISLLAIFAAIIGGGCLSERRSVVPLVENVGGEVSTKYRYRLSCVYYDEMAEQVTFDGSFLGRQYPQVFSATGLPFVLRINNGGKMSAGGSWTDVLAVCTCGLVPFVYNYTMEYNCYAELADDVAIRVPFGLKSINDSASSPLPTAYLFYNGATEVDGRRVFCESTKHSSDKDPSMDFVFSLAPVLDFDRQVSYGGYGIKGYEVKANALGQQALAYALAVKLKELEDSGKIDAMLMKKAADRSLAPPHSIVRLERDSDNAFSYSFAIEMSSAPSDMKAAAKSVLREFSASVKEDYLDAHQSVDTTSLMVSFSNLKVNGLRIEGRASVLTIKPISLSYDANTRRGKLSVRSNAGQIEEARAWIRKNIKTLARDKNIALVTGNPPPEATYYPLVGEKIEGNVLEIEFKTE